MAGNNPGLPFEELFPIDVWLVGRVEFSDPVLIMIGTLVFGSYIAANQIVAPYLERKVMARMQGRRGPVYVGKSGSLQILADTFKLIIKEDLRPAGADKVGFFLSMLLIIHGQLL